MNKKEKSLHFKELIEQHKGILYKVARTYCQLESEREDLLQEIQIQIWKSLDKYNNKFKISTWLYRIALNVAISFYRKNIKRYESNITWENQLPNSQDEDSYNKEYKLNLLEQFISKLNDLDKAIMLLYLEDKSHNEIADIIGISLSNVGTKISRIKNKLKINFSQIKS